MNDRDRLRELAKVYHEIASQEIQDERRNLFRALNRRKPVRPVVLIDEIPWNQFQNVEELKNRCVGDRERKLETFFLRQIYRWNHFRCDMVLNDFIECPKHIKIGSFGINKEENILAYDKKNNVVSHQYTDQIPDEDAIDKMHIPEVLTDTEADDRDYEWLSNLFGDIMPVRITGTGEASFFVAWDNISEWRGAENLLWDLIDRPEFSMKLMRKLTDIRLGLLEKLEDMDLLDNSNPYIHCTAGLADELPEREKRKLTRKDIWGRGAAQIFSSVSPEMLREFELPYAKEFFSGFGLVYYGCCEPLDKRIDLVRSIPNLRKISISPWADAENAADQIGSDFVMAFKPNPAYMASDVLNLDVIKGDITKALSAARKNHTPIELTLKDISTINYKPQNLDIWAEQVMNLVESE